MKYFTIYKMTNKVNGKVYIGQHIVKSVFAKDHYIGSGGKRYQNAIKKYGKENFSKEIITIAVSQLEADALEQYYIEKYDSTNPEKGYNTLVGGQGSGRCENQIPWNKGKKLGPHTEEHKRKIGLANKGNKRPDLAEYNKKYKKGVSVKGHPQSEESKRKQSEKMKGHTTSEETRRKLSEKGKGKNNWSSAANKGRHWYNNGIDNVFTYECPEGYTPGRSPKVKETLSNSMKGRVPWNKRR